MMKGLIAILMTGFMSQALYGKDRVQTVKAVSAGSYHSCAIKTDNTVLCWGRNHEGQRTIPADLGHVKAVSAGWLHTCAIRTNNTMQCWGFNNHGQSTVPANLRRH